MALKINDENAKELIASGKPVVIDFWAEWCGPCRAIAPSVDELAEEYEGKVIIGKYNVDDDADLSAEYSIRNIPTLLFFKEGNQRTNMSVLLRKPIWKLKSKHCCKKSEKEIA